MLNFGRPIVKCTPNQLFSVVVMVNVYLTHAGH